LSHNAVDDGCVVTLRTRWSPSLWLCSYLSYPPRSRTISVFGILQVWHWTEHHTTSDLWSQSS